MKVTGKVTKSTFAPGSKSEHPGVFISTDQERYLLRQLGGNAFQDSALDALVGKTVQAEGELHGGTFIASDLKELPGEM
jgi:hypothetical protein